MVTIYHWDMPMRLITLGGMSNPDIVGYFEAYADLLFKRFGDRVKYWVTFNEPLKFCNQGNFVNTIPYLSSLPGADSYLCTHHMLQSHAKMYALYRRKYFHFKGKVGIALNTQFAYPKNPNSLDDIAAAYRALQFYVCIRLGRFTFLK